MKPLPTNQMEHTLREQGYRVIVGVDEAGCGALAGPVVAAAVALPVLSALPVRDSKQLSAKQRGELFPLVVEEALCCGVGVVSAKEIDRMGIRPATLFAMRKAVGACYGVEYALVDAWTIPNIVTPQTGIIRGDAQERLIAAASIVAKVTRDRLMVVMSEALPQYGFAMHKGYGTAAHRGAIREYGMSAEHRKTFTCK